MYIDTLTYQVREFFYSFSFGFILGLVYDLTRALRISFNNKKSKIFIWDIVYSLICAFLSVLFLLSVCDGKVQFYLLFSIALGFFIYYLTLGEIVRRILKRAVFVFKKMFEKYIFVIFRKIVVFFKEKIKNRKIISKKDLQLDDTMMYNEKNNCKMAGRVNSEKNR